MLTNRRTFLASASLTAIASPLVFSGTADITLDKPIGHQLGEGFKVEGFSGTVRQILEQLYLAKLNDNGQLISFGQIPARYLVTEFHSKYMWVWIKTNGRYTLKLNEDPLGLNVQLNGITEVIITLSAYETGAFQVTSRLDPPKR